MSFNCLQGNPSALEGSEPDSEADKVSGSDIDWDSGAPEDEYPESETGKLSGSETDWDSGEPEDMDPESETKEMLGSDTDWDPSEPEDEDPKSEIGELSGSDTDWDSGEPEDEDPESEANEKAGSDTDWDSGEPEDIDPESETGALSETGTNWDSGEPGDMDPDSQTDELLGSGTDWDSGEPEDEDSELEEDQLLGSGTDRDSGGLENMEPQLETDKLSSDTEWGTRKNNVDSKDLAISSELNKLFKLRRINLGNHLSKKVTHLLKSRPSLLDSFHKELKDASHHSPKVRRAHLGGLPKSTHASVKENEYGPEINDLVSNSGLKDMEPQSETDKLRSNTELGTHKKNVDNKDLVISSELNKLLKLRHINLGNHLDLSKKVAHLLKSRPSLLASFHKELKDASRHSPKVRDAYLGGLPKSIPGTNINANEHGPEIDDLVSNSAPKDMEPQSETDKPSSDFGWGAQKKNVDSKDLVISSELSKLLKLRHINMGKNLSEKVEHLLKSRPSLLPSFRKELKDASHYSPKVRDADLRRLLRSTHETTMNANEHGLEVHDLVRNSAPEDMELRSEADNLSSDTKWGSSAPEDADPESEAGKAPLSATEWDTGSPQTLTPELKHNVFSLLDIKSDTGGAPVAVESKVMPSRRSQDDPESALSVEAPDQNTIEKEKLKLPMDLPNTLVMKNLSRLSGIPMHHEKNSDLNLNIRLKSLGNQGVHTNNGKTKKSEQESGGAVARVLTTLVLFGGLLMVLLMAAVLVFAW